MSVICKTAANDQPAVVNSRSIFWEQALTGSKKSHSEESPLTAVGVSGQHKINIKICDILWIVFGVMVEQNFVSRER